MSEFELTCRQGPHVKKQTTSKQLETIFSGFEGFENLQDCHLSLIWQGVAVECHDFNTENCIK